LELARRQTTKGEERTTLNVEDSTVVVPKKRRYRGASRQKILMNLMAQLFLPMHLLGSAYPSHAD